MQRYLGNEFVMISMYNNVMLYADIIVRINYDTSAHASLNEDLNEKLKSFRSGERTR